MAVRIFRSQVVGTRYDGAPLEWIECACDSDDDKPVGVATGSKCTEADTGDVYLYSEDDGEWTKVSNLGGNSGGGGGGSGNGLYMVKFRWNADLGQYECDKTFEELSEVLMDETPFPIPVVAFVYANGSTGCFSVKSEVRYDADHSVDPPVYWVDNVKFEFLYNAYWTSENSFGYEILVYDKDGITSTLNEYTLTPNA